MIFQILLGFPASRWLGRQLLFIFLLLLLVIIITSSSQTVSFALIFYTYICRAKLDENGIVRLNIDFLICIKSIVLWPNLGKMTTKFRFRATPP
jgi:hypothetical protein